MMKGYWMFPRYMNNFFGVHISWQTYLQCRKRWSLFPATWRILQCLQDEDRFQKKNRKCWEDSAGSTAFVERETELMSRTHCQKLKIETKVCFKFMACTSTRHSYNTLMLLNWRGVVGWQTSWIECSVSRLWYVHQVETKLLFLILVSTFLYLFTVCGCHWQSRHWLSIRISLCIVLSSQYVSSY